MARRRYRVIQWGTGYTGMFSLRYVLDNSAFDLVGIKCVTSGKEGMDAGEIAGGPPIGVTATADRASLLALEADCVLFMPRDALGDPSVPDNPSAAWIPDLIAILESGKNVVTPICSGTHWRHLANGDVFRKMLDSACAKGNSTVFFSGFDPGFATDALPFSMAAVVGKITQIRTWEILDYSKFPVEATLRQMGFGVRPDDFSFDVSAMIRATWGGAIYLLGDAFGVSIERVDVDHAFELAGSGFTTPVGVEVAAGTIAALNFSIVGIVNGQKRFSVNHISRMDARIAPDWPTLGQDGGYRIEIDAFPPFVGEFPMGLPGGTGAAFHDAVAMTTARCLNAVEAVVAARPGYATFLDLVPLGGRYAFVDQASVGHEP